MPSKKNRSRRRGSGCIDHNTVYDPVDFDKFRSLLVKQIEPVLPESEKQKRKELTAHCNFDYINELLTVQFNSAHNFKVQSYSAFHDVNVQGFKLCQPLTLVDKHEASKVFQMTHRFSHIPIDFFGFSPNRWFMLDIVYEVYNHTLCAKFQIDLPILNQAELRFKPPATIYPDESMRRICEQEFQMNEDNSAQEMIRCIHLEEFRNLPISQRFNDFSYIYMQETFIDIENSFELNLLKKFHMIGKVEKVGPTFYRINTTGWIPQAAAYVCLTPLEIANQKLSAKELMKNQFNGPIEQFYRKSVVVEIKRNRHRDFDLDQTYVIEFRPNFYSNAIAQRALKRVIHFENFISSFNEDSLAVKPETVQQQQFTKIKWMNRNVGRNQAQSTAIKHIVNRTSFPLPYVIFGPPGTGKTSTLVEAVTQIVMLQPKARILITVNANSACDEIGERLVKFIGANKMFRFYSPSFCRKMQKVHPQLKMLSNLRYNFPLQPTIVELLNYRVVISTLVNCGRLFKLKPDHFDYIFVDECASSAEVYVDIPISLGLEEDCPITASVVLLGDPKQLGQIMRTYHSERYGFGVSLMERVMHMPNYKFREDGYDPKFIVQLVDNFRSHPAILSFSNQQFYNSTLKARQDDSVANFAIGWELLANKDYPIVFQASWTASEMDGTSHYNYGDIAFVIKYVGTMLRDGINGKDVFPEDIGIISPYAAQREKLMEIFDNIEIGTVEQFQGREKLVIVVSGVRSKTLTIGFLKNEKRLNVALTRAKALLIVIGNPETLSKSSFWRKFIKQCYRNNAVAGKIPSWIHNKNEKHPEDLEEEEEDDVIRLEELQNGLEMDE